MFLRLQCAALSVLGFQIEVEEEAPISYNRTKNQQTIFSWQVT